jgi:putative copper export protein/mono/diheme cytochrome c family protein
MFADALIAARTIHFASTVLVGGVVCFRVVVAGRAMPFGRRLAPRLKWLALSNLVVSILSALPWLSLVAAEMSGQQLSDVIGGDTIATVLTQTQFGRVWIARIVLGLLLGALLTLFPWRSRWHEPVALVLAAGFVGSLAWMGHAGATPGSDGDIHLISDIAHALAAAAWVGGLVPLALSFAAARRAHDPAAMAATTQRFSMVGMASVAVLLASGIINAYFLIGSVPGLLGTLYGQLLLVKVALFAGMLALAVVNRLRLTPLLAAPVSARAARRLQRNSMIEAALGLAIIAIVGVLGTLPPGAHQQPRWPLPFRIDDSVFAAPELRPNALLMFIAVIALVGAAAATTSGRRLRWPAVVIGGLCVVIFGWAARPAVIPAFPTTYYASPTGFTFASIARGKDLFATYCAGCHGDSGRGDGLDAKTLDVKPPDLTAEQIYAHRDGDLFWWIGHGIGDAMPGFEPPLDESARWNLIDFIRANADGARLRQGEPDLSNAFPTPAFSAECPDGSIVSNEDLHERFVRVVVTAPQEPAPTTRNEDVATLLVPLAPGVAAGAACVVRDPDAASALAVYRGTAVTEAVGTQLLIDPHGRLRALWHPGRDPDWNDADKFDGVVDQINETPVAGGRTATHAHAH